MKTELTPIAKIKTNPDNPRVIKDDKFDKLVKSIQEFPEMLDLRPIVVNSDMMVLGGNMRLRACQKAGLKEVPVLKADDLTPEQQKRFIITDNASFGAWDYDVLANEWEVADLEAWGVDVPDWGDSEGEEPKKLSDIFIIPPLSILDTKQGQWQDRKNYWLSLGIKGEIGRDGGLTFAKSAQAPRFYEIKSELREKGLPCGTEDVWNECKKRGYKLFGGEEGWTSTFDPVLCELVYRWFNIPKGKIIDPFAGGSVRGIVAAIIGCEYLGNDLSEKQIMANRENAKEVIKDTEIYPTWKCGDSLQIDTIAKDYKADLMFTCPPYADLEVYSDAKEDISNMSYGDFLTIYREIIRKSCQMLKPDRFAVFVVGDVRDKKGFYRNFVSDTIQAFVDCGVLLYNEMILVNQIGSAAMRAGRFFNSGRKVVKHHQNVLVFYKGDPKKIRENYPKLDLSYLKEGDE
jgi:hypothetical protein